jgi:hypothetical protein
MADGTDRRTPPGVALSLILSLLALILSVVAIVIAYDPTHSWFRPAPNVEVQAAPANWSRRVRGVQMHLNRAEQGLKAGDAKTTATPVPQNELDATVRELEAWTAQIETPLRQEVDDLAAQAVAARDALTSGTEAALKRIDALRQSVKAFDAKFSRSKPAAPSKPKKE